MTMTSRPLAGATTAPMPTPLNLLTADVVEVSFLGRCTFDGSDSLEIKLYRVSRRGDDEVKTHCGNLTFTVEHARDYVASMKNLKLIDHASGGSFELWSGDDKVEETED